jgi:hypothetical protein
MGNGGIERRKINPQTGKKNLVGEESWLYT